MQQGLFCYDSERGDSSTEANSVLSDDLDCCCSASSTGDDVAVSTLWNSEVPPSGLSQLQAIGQEVSDAALELRGVALEAQAAHAVELDDMRHELSSRASDLRAARNAMQDLRHEVCERASALRRGEPEACTVDLFLMRQEIERRALSLRIPAAEKRVRDDLQRALADAVQLDLLEACTSQLQDVRTRLMDRLASARELSLRDGLVREVELHRRRVNFAIQDRKGQLRVCCRVRPMSIGERALGDAVVVQAVGDTSLKVAGVGAFDFDHVFAPGSQEEIFEDCRDLIEAAFDGRNATIFAYGQTGAGKTHTMYGSPGSEGVAPRTIDHLFDIIKERTASSCTVVASMVDIYNNQLVDLLAPVDSSFGAPRSRLAVRLAAEGGDVWVDGLRESVVESAAELRALFASGLSRRLVARGTMNAVSSRSHLLFTIKVMHANQQTGETLNGKIILCDLGGCEQLKQTTLSAERKKETIELNKALSALGNVFMAVAKKQEQVPYRDHLLTRLLQDSIGGTAKTLMFLNCSPTLTNVKQTTSALKFGTKARTIINKAKKVISDSS